MKCVWNKSRVCEPMRTNGAFKCKVCGICAMIDLNCEAFKVKKEERIQIALTKNGNYGCLIGTMLWLPCSHSQRVFFSWWFSFSTAFDIVEWFKAFIVEICVVNNRNIKFDMMNTFFYTEAHTHTHTSTMENTRFHRHFG